MTLTQPNSVNHRLAVTLGLAFASIGIATAAEPIYQQDFNDRPLGELPGEFMVMDGDFTVVADGSNRVLEVPGTPVETFGVLLPMAEPTDLRIQARIFATRKKRRMPAFAVSLGGVSGYYLQITPAKRALELFRGEELVKSVPFRWSSGQWTTLRLQVRQVKPGEWRIDGAAHCGDPAPAVLPWLLKVTTQQEPISGRAGIWGKPYAETPIRFDDLKLSPAEE